MTWVVPILLAGVLAGLALLQYRWSNEISQATTTRIHAALQTSMMNFREDLSRQLGTLCLELQEPSISALKASGLSEKIQLWQATSSVPGLTKNVYFWTVSKSGGRTLFQLDMTEDKFDSIAWPPRLQPLRQVLFSVPSRQILAAIPASTSTNGRSSSKIRQPAYRIGGIDQGIPLLVVPASPSNLPSNWLLVELDLKVLQQQLLPQLAARYFGDPRNSDYEVAITATSDKNSQVIYASNPDFLKGGSGGDTSLNLFGPPAPHGRTPGSPVDFFRTPNTLTAGSTNGESDDNGGIFGPIRFDPIHYESDDVDWRIVVRHHKGSIAAEVAGLRRRNLALSFGVLLVLAASMALIMFNSHRARRLAMLQMDFVAGVSHELRTPVAAILLISDNMASDLVKDKQQFTSYGDLIRTQARQLNHLVQQVLRFSATTKKASSYELLPIQVSDIIDEVLENTAVLILSSGVEVHRTLEPNLPVVYADFSSLSQCLQNLVTNAVKYGGERKWISIHARKTETGRSPEVELTVKDQGIGIEPEYLHHIFDPFYRSPKVAGSDIHGTGLGLALAKSFVEAMGGSITVTSEVGRGTAFTVHLPVKAAQSKPLSEVEQDSSV